MRLKVALCQCMRLHGRPLKNTQFYEYMNLVLHARAVSTNFNHLKLIDKWACTGIQEPERSIIGCSHDWGAGRWHGAQDSDGWVASRVQLCHHTAHKWIPQVHHRVTGCSQTQWLQECDGKDCLTMTWVGPLTLCHRTSITLFRSDNRTVMEHIPVSLTTYKSLVKKIN